MAKLNFSYNASETTTTNAVEAALKVKVHSVEPSVGAGTGSSNFNSNSTTKFYSHTVGGESTTFTRVEDFFADSGYRHWVNSIGTAGGESQLCGIASVSDSLVPIWELVRNHPNIPDNNAKANALERKYNDLIAELGYELEGFRTVKVTSVSINRNTPDVNTNGEYTFTLPARTAPAYDPDRLDLEALPREPLPARFNVYLVGGGGGGQGENRNYANFLNIDYGTGGAGGGGAAALLSFDTTEAVSIALRVGQGGTGGARHTDRTYGYPGDNGTYSSARWNGITITANGGQGGGQNGGVTGGTYGTTSVPESTIINRSTKGFTGSSVNVGTSGDKNQSTKESIGGTAGKIDSIFGGASGGTNRDSNDMNGREGGGGAGAAWSLPASTGGRGGDGLIRVDYYYFE